MKTFVLILLLNTFSSDGKGAIEKVEGFTTIEQCETAGQVFDSSYWAQYHYCIEVK